MIALYREFRPKTFDDVVGQNHITKTLVNQVKNNTITHAYLFTGPRGTGKTSCAKIFSKAINCLNTINGSPCGECEVCKALNDVNTDILEIDAASNNRVDEIRELRERVKYPPVIGKKKVYIIDEVHMLTESAFNALLKTLEEPPKYVVFILATTEVHKLPATILSRCTRFDFRLLSVDELVGQLKRVFDARQIKYDEESLYLIAKQGEGSVRDTLSIADSVVAYSDGEITTKKTLEVLGLSSIDQIANIVCAIGNRDVAGVFSSIENSLQYGKNISLLCKELTEFFKNLVLVSQNITDFKVLGIMPTDVDVYKELAGLFNLSQLKTAFEKLSRIELDLKFSLNPKNLIESVCISLIDSGNEQSLAAKQVTKIENTSSTVSINAQMNNVQPNNTQTINQGILNNEIGKVNSQISNKTADTQSNNVNMQKINNQNSKDNANIGKIWGEVLKRIKEKNMFALSASLKNIYGVTKSGRSLVLRTNDKSVFELVDLDEKKSVILNVLKEICADIDLVQVEYDENNKSQQDIINNLKETFLDKIKIKG